MSPRAREHQVSARSRLGVVGDEIAITKTPPALAKRFKAGLTDVSPGFRALIQSISRGSLIRWRQALREGGWFGLVPDQPTEHIRGARLEAR